MTTNSDEQGFIMANQKQRTADAGEQKQAPLKEGLARAKEAGPDPNQPSQIAQKANRHRQQKGMHKQDGKR